MAKINIKAYEPLLTVNVHLQWKEKLLDEEYARLRSGYLRGLMYIKSADKKSIVLTAPANMPLSSYLSNGIKKQDFFDVLVHIINVLRSVAATKLSLANLCLDADNIFVNVTTKELFFIYCPIEGEGMKGNLAELLNAVAYKTNFRMPAEMVVKQELMIFIRTPSNINTQKLEEFVRENCPDKAAKIEKIGSISKPKVAESKSDFIRQKSNMGNTGFSQNVVPNDSRAGTDYYYKRSGELMQEQMHSGMTSGNLAGKQSYEYNGMDSGTMGNGGTTVMGMNPVQQGFGVLAGMSPMQPNGGTTVMDMNPVQPSYVAPAGMSPMQPNGGTTVMDMNPVQPSYVAPAGMSPMQPNGGTTVMDMNPVQPSYVAPAEMSSMQPNGGTTVMDMNPVQPSYVAPAGMSPMQPNGGTTVMDMNPVQPDLGTTVMSGGAETTLLSETPTYRNPRLRRIKTGEEVSINKPVFRIGKEEGYVDYLVSDNPAVSRNHADIISRDGRFYIYDNNSTNKTYVNSIMIPSLRNVEIEEGSHIRLANEDFIFIIKE